MRFGLLDLNLLIALEALMEERSVSGAARRLNMSQSALSGSLARLRDYFKDELLVLVGRSMMPTPFGIEIADHAKTALTLIRSTITTAGQFEPATAERTFSIIASDYLYDVMLADALRNIAAEAPYVSFDISMPSEHEEARFEMGEVDLYITLEPFLANEHPSRFLFEDQLAVVAWDRSSTGDSITEEEFLNRSHVVVTFGTHRHPSFSENFFNGLGTELRKEMKVQTYSAVPAAVVGTERLGTMNRRHAEYFARLFPLKVLPLPMPAPSLREAMQWHTTRKGDSGIKWLKDRMLEATRNFRMSGMG